MINNNNLCLFINNCINLENNIADINSIDENIKTIQNLEDLEILFDQDEKETNEILEKIKNFGKIKCWDKNNTYLYNKSSIIKDDIDKQEAILNWIKEKTKKNTIQIEQIFKMSENGTKNTDFYNKCENQGPTLVLIKTTKNKIFGGFTP